MANVNLIDRELPTRLSKCLFSIGVPFRLCLVSSSVRVHSLPRGCRSVGLGWCLIEIGRDKEKTIANRKGPPTCIGGLFLIILANGFIPLFHFGLGVHRWR